MDLILFTTLGSCRDMERFQQQYRGGIFTRNNHTAENNTTQNMFAFSIMPSNAYWQILLICIDIYVYAMITRDWLEKTEAWLRRKYAINVNN